MSIPITSRPGLGLGVSYDLRLLGAVGMRPELRYAQRGWAHERQVRFDDPSVIARTETALDVMTIGVPARLRVGPATGWQASLLVGPEVALRVRCHATTTGASYGRATCDIPQLTRTISRAHVALIAALHADRALGPGRLGAELRYTHGITDPLDELTATGLRQRALEAQATYAPSRGLSSLFGSGRLSVGMRGARNRATEEVHSTANISYLERLPISGVEVGLVARYRVGPVLAAQTEVAYTREGYAYQSGARTEARLDFIQVPVLLVLSPPPCSTARIALRPYLLAGAGLGVQVAATRTSDGPFASSQFDGDVDGVAPGLIGGVGVDLVLGGKTVGFELRHRRSALGPAPNIFTFEPLPTTHSRVWSLSVVVTQGLGHSNPLD